MRRKNKLPDSLELLLDTMCNTFGAIMFIAISLVIISQFSIKAVKAKKPLNIDEEHLGKMRRQVRDLNQTLAEEEPPRMVSTNFRVDIRPVHYADGKVVKYVVLGRCLPAPVGEYVVAPDV